MSADFLGPMPAEKFLDEFMACAPEPCPVVDFSGMLGHQKEWKMYQPFIGAIKRSNLCPGLIPLAIPAKPTRKGDERLKSNVALYLEEFIDDVRENPRDAISWRAMEMHIEIKLTDNYDPFVDPDATQEIGANCFKNRSRFAVFVRRRITAYATAQLIRQHRLFMFSLVIFGKYARLFRWDRAGVVVSNRIDYTTRPTILAEFLWRFGHLSAVQRGQDPTVLPATPAEEDMFMNAIKKSSEMASGGKLTRQVPGMHESVDESFPRWKMQVNDREKGTCEFIIGKPVASSDSATGRCTRGYVALDLSSNRLMFLKDAWRLENVDSEPEQETYRKLAESNVPCVASFFCGDDVVDPSFYETVSDDDSTGSPGSPSPDGSSSRPGVQMTKTQEYAGDRNPLYLQQSIHYRMVQDSLYFPLEQFDNSKHLVQIIYDALRGLGGAWENAKVLHRDVSGGNIMITQSGSGVLNDWDLSRPLSSTQSQQPEDRTGTWPFISTALLLNPGRTHEIYDDLESVFFVLLWYALRYAKHNNPGAIRMDQLFFESRKSLVSGKWQVLGGGGKSFMYAVGWDLYFRGLAFSSGPLNDLLVSLHDLFGGLHHYISSKESRKRPYYSDFHKLQTPKEVLRLFEEALAREDWPENDKVEDQMAGKPRMESSSSGAESKRSTGSAVASYLPGTCLARS